MRRAFGKLALRLLPKRALTLLVGSAARQPWSRYLIPWYIRHYHINSSEAQFALKDYKSLVDFFARSLRAGARKVAESGVVSPVDGTVSELGVIQDGTLIQAKGSHYSLTALLGGDDLANRYRNGFYITLYLSPRDYHRIHAPINGTIYFWRYIPGTLYPVNPAGVKHIPGLFTKNERIITQLDSPCGKFAVVKVGATIVGSIRTDYGPAFCGPFRRRRLGMLSGTTEIPVVRGQEMGRFEFGSTVILLFEPGMIDQLHVQFGQFVRMGESLADLRNG